MYIDKKILIVDDSPIVRRLISTMLVNEGYRYVEMVENGREAIIFLNEKKVDLILLDYNMPEMNGEEVLNYIKEHYPDVIVIMLSDQTDRNVVISLMRKADDYIVKAEIEKLKGELLHVFNRCFGYQELKTKNKELMDKLSQRNKKLEEEIQMARKLQREIFPDKIESSAAFSIYVLTKPCHTVGGDFFDIVRLDPGHIGIFLGDICGHGMQAALLSFTLANAFKAAIKSNEKISAQKTVMILNSLLVKQFPAGSFAAGSYLVLSEQDSVISFSGAFETPLLYYALKGEINQLTNGNIAYLGLVDNQMVRIDESMIQLKKGEKVFVFTDGLVEVKNAKHERFSVGKIAEILKNHPDESIKTICNTLYSEVKKYSNNIIYDDITIIGIERK
ncbi:MAG: SpoIIE family protein phosphatase [Spirochaetales bacterium]|nr:SpoIIE family protein phosphatase [Spirochaetales bacterium]